MNLIVLLPSDFLDLSIERVNSLNDSGCSDVALVRLTDHRAKHIYQVHQADEGRHLKVGLLNGKLGLGVIKRVEQDADQYLVEMQVSLNQLPPAKLPLTVLLALPRPKMLRRIIQSLTALGVDHLVLINSYRVEKSYWQSPFLSKLDEYVSLGLEQSVDTVPMTIQRETRFKPFVEDQLPELLLDKVGLVAHPYADNDCPRAVTGKHVLAIGPEGGFIDYEIQKLQEAGFHSVSLGSRIQKVETVLPQLIGRLF